MRLREFFFHVLAKVVAIYISSHGRLNLMVFSLIKLSKWIEMEIVISSCTINSL